jgi:hypothetical protein
MNLLPTTAAPGVAERAEALADAACELHDAASDPQARPGEQTGSEVQPIRSDSQWSACLPDPGRPADTWDRPR